MTQDQLDRKLKLIESISKIPRKVDGFTFDEYEIIIDAIGKAERACYDSHAIWLMGMKNTYTSLYLKYHEVFEMEKT
jgi:hypothetical protein